MENNDFIIDITKQSDYITLFQTLKEENIKIDSIIYLSAISETGPVLNIEELSPALNSSVFGLLYLSQALSEIHDHSHSIRLLAVSYNASNVNGKGTLSYQYSSMPGLLKSISQEFNFIGSHHIDLEKDSNEANAERIIKEIYSFSMEEEIAYRNNKRWVTRFKKINFSEMKSGHLPIHHKGMYLISGGLGGIGFEIAKYFLENHETNLLIIGRTKLPDIKEWHKHLGKESKEGSLIERLQILNNLNGKILYQKADITQFSELKNALKIAKDKWNSDLSGIFNLAGLYHEKSLKDEDKESFYEILSPKIAGTYNLNEIVLSENKHNDSNFIFVNFSSMAGFFGHMMIGAYATANIFLDTFTSYQNNQYAFKSFCFAWSNWDNTGMSKGLNTKDSFQKAMSYPYPF